MNLLIVAATEYEVASFSHDLKFMPYPVDILIGGVGMVSTAFALGKKLTEKKYDALVNVGIAGSFNRENELGALVRVKNDSFSELGAQNENDFLSIEEMGFGKSVFHENAGPLLITPSVTMLKTVTGITVNKVHGNEASIKRVIDRLNPEIESMEGAASFYAAQQLGIYTLQVRSISNYVETRNRANWKIDLAIQNLNDWLKKFTLELFS